MENIEKDLRMLSLERIIKITQETAIKMYQAYSGTYKPISYRKAVVKYGKARLEMWDKQNLLHTSATRTGQIRYNDKELEALHSVENKFLPILK
jgi:hypothetical protein